MPEILRGTRSLVVAAAGALFCLMTLAGCSSAPSDAQVIQTLESAVSKAVPDATSVTVGMGYDGPNRRTVSMRLYLDRSDSSTVTSAVDSALRAVWSKSPVLPSSVVVSVVDGPKPSDGSKGVGVDLAATARALGVPVPDVGRDLLLARSAELQKLYGARPADVSAQT
jgi:hypothetical protein